MNKEKEENVKVYVRSVIRFGKFLNNYKLHFINNEVKRKNGIEYYSNRISLILKEIDELSEEEKQLFYDTLNNFSNYYKQEEIKKLKTLQFGYAKIFKENYMAVDAVLKIKNNKNKENILENN